MPSGLATDIAATGSGPVTAASSRAASDSQVHLARLGMRGEGAEPPTGPLPHWLPEYESSAYSVAAVPSEW